MKTKWPFTGTLLISLFSGCSQDDLSSEKGGYPSKKEPQGEAIRIFNYMRLVKNN